MSYRRNLLGIIILLSTIFYPCFISSVSAQENQSGGSLGTPLQSPPKITLQTDKVEIVGLVEEGHLWFYLDDYATNLPLRGVDVKVELFDKVYPTKEIGLGVYMVQEVTFAVPHRYELFFIINSPSLNDRIPGILAVKEVQEAQKEALIPEQPWGNTAIFLLIFSLIVLVLLTKFTKPQRLRRRPRKTSTGTLSIVFLVFMLSVSAEQVFAHSEHEEQGNIEIFSGAMIDKSRKFPDGSVYLPKMTQHLIGIQTQTIKPRIVKVGVRLSGHVQANPNFAGRVQAAQAGRVEVVGATLPHIGQWVNKNDLLIRISSIAARFEQGNQQAQLASLESALHLARNKLVRLRKLSGTIPRKTIDEAESEVRSLKGRYEAVSQSLVLREPLYAPVNGFITKASVLPGQIVEAREILFEIMNPERLQIEALAYEDFQSLEFERAEVVIDEAHPIPLISLGKGAVLRGHALPLLFDIDMENPPLSVGQVVNVIITTSQKVRGRPVPRESLVKNALGKNIIWLHTEAEIFQPIPVDWRTVDDESIVITSPLPKNSRIVTNHASRLLQIR